MLEPSSNMHRPNIIWIYCDELRADALGCYGNRQFAPQTPHIDSIAAEGSLFERCYCNSPVCVASRTSVLTGLYPSATGVYHNEATWPNFVLNPVPQTLPEVFAQHGYRTVNFGKTHVNRAILKWDVHDPAGGGMDAFFAQQRAAELRDVGPPGPERADIIWGGSFPADLPYPAGTVTRNAIRWIDTAEAPYFMRVSYLQPHTPVLPPPPYDSLYDPDLFDPTCEINPRLSVFEQQFARIAGIHQLTPAQRQRTQAYYYGLVSWLDAQVGQILDALQQRNLLEQTIIIFDADHGNSLGDDGRHGKQTFAPESHRVPRIVQWSGFLPAGVVRRDLCESLDLARTLFALVGIDPPAQFKGRDLFSDPAPQAVYGTIGFGFPNSTAFSNLFYGRYADGRGWPRRSCIRTDQYRLDFNSRIDGRQPDEEDEDVALYLSDTDPVERANQAADPAHQTTVDELLSQLKGHLANSVEYPEDYTRLP